MQLTEIGCDVLNWIHLAQDRVQWQAFVIIKGREFLDSLTDYQLLEKDPAA
jgi:hypothetical protein